MKAHIVQAIERLKRSWHQEIEEAAVVLRISRGAAYDLARQYLATGYGLPVLRLGRTLRVPRAGLLRLLGEDDAEPLG